ncbi:MULTISPECIES: hypothetical protein [Paenibacillus]|uniref:DUF4878 domain-containing protein n=1 Tax=Paenibacillus cucumis (ex Kampfer et al. 2016) TaxID=1776858 RepID=A0ABS7KF66_9BACL|nr:MULTISPECIES: hypothetical protein [Paenibacillus]MBY0202783.1 hypothetical protein [Paenibacillus cucumis (ex Kampfer et al. 2016)]MDP9700425.1 hypothetical protein [Paenibacillus intestini]
MRRLKVFSIVCVLFFGISTTIFANESTSNSEASEFILREYLEASVNQDYERLSRLTEDHRYNSLEEKQQEYKSSLENPSEVPLSFTIIDQQRVSDKEYNYSVKLEFPDNEIINLPINMKNINENWKVIISTQPVNEQKGYEIIEHADDNLMIQKNQALAEPQPSTKCTWSFSERVDGRTFTSLCKKFDLSTKDYRTTLNLQQYNDHKDKIIPLIKYEIFETKFFGDNLWGYTDVYGEKKGVGFKAEIFGDTLKATNCYIKFSIENSKNTVTTFKGFGELYSF